MDSGRKLVWTKTPMSGWTRHEAKSEDGHWGPYIVEKEDTRSFGVWWGHHEIGSASSIPEARSMCQRHCDSL